MKILISLAMIFFLILIYLGFSGIITINFNKLMEAVGQTFNLGQKASSWLIPIISTIPLTGSFIFGFILGFKAG